MRKAGRMVNMHCLRSNLHPGPFFSILPYCAAAPPSVSSSLPLRFLKFEPARKTGEVGKKINFAVHPVGPRAVPSPAGVRKARSK